MSEAASWAGTPSIKGSSESMRMALLTFSLIGLQFTWGIEMTYCTPYLLQLGLTKSKTSLVWIAGPLSGLIMQPVVGVIADRSKSKWGRRRPFMVGGALIVGCCLVVLGWTSEIVGVFVADPETRKSGTIALAVLSIYAVDFAINAVQSSCRSLIVDTLPIPKQQLGSAWASRMVASGHVIGYVAGTVNLVGIFGKTFGDTQFKQLCLISAAVLLLAVGVTSYSVKERVLLAGRESDAKTGAIHMFAQILKTTLNLPPRIQAICWAQFWAWIGWFPFLFYSTTWVGETYFRYDVPHKHPATSPTPPSDALGEIGRVGSLSLVIFSLVSFTGSLIFPWLIVSPDDMGKKRKFTPRPPASLAPLISGLNLDWVSWKPDLLTAWLVSHLVFSFTMIWAPFVSSLKMATVLVSICGVPWALTSWAPFAFMGVEINKIGASSPSTPPHHSSSTLSHTTSTRANGSTMHTYHLLSPSLHDGVENDTHEMTSSPSPSSHLHSSSSHSASASLLDPEHSPSTDLPPHSSTGELAGIYLGILNLFTTLPQFVGTFISTIVFALLEPGMSPELAGGAGGKNEGEADIPAPGDGVNAIAVCLFIGALSTFVAAYATSRMRHVA
ncbi:MAG: hypothetical protein M1817_005015 [Caeruleum heppii]|nr:MAG: hypothetical protein M1817_005015 [Caeruleum heppii]